MPRLTESELIELLALGYDIGADHYGGDSGTSYCSETGCTYDEVAVLGDETVYRLLLKDSLPRLVKKYCGGTDAN